MITAMILCAGFGTRLNELTQNTPKPMLPLGDRPILEHTILHLRNCGIKKIVINLHFKGEQIKNHFGDGESFGVDIHYSYERKPLGTAGGVKKVEKILAQSDTFLVLYGDIATNLNYENLIMAHRRHGGAGTIVLHERNVSNSVVEIDNNNLITRFLERPRQPVQDKKQRWVNSGLYCFDSSIFELIPSNIKVDFPKDIFPGLVTAGKLFGYPLDGYRCAVDSPERLKQLQNDYLNHIFQYT